MRAELADDSASGARKEIHGAHDSVLNSADTFDFTTPLYPARITGRDDIDSVRAARDAVPGHLVAETVIGNYDGERFSCTRT